MAGPFQPYLDFAFRNPAAHWSQYLNRQPITPVPGETNLGYGINSYVPQFLQGAGNRVGEQFGAIGERVGSAGLDVAKSLAYAFNPATGPAAPEQPPTAGGARPFSGSSMSANPASFHRTPTPENAQVALPFNVPAGAIITSTYRDPQHNKDVGGVSNSYHTRRDAQGRPLAVDMVPGHGQSMGQLFAQVKQQNPGADVLNEGNHIHIEPGPNGAGIGPASSAFQQAADATGLNAPPPAFDASGYRTADALLRTAQGAAIKPFSATYQETPLPELPKPAPLQTPDYTAGDTAMAAAQPKNPFGMTPEEQAHGQLKLRRMDYFAGMAQAMNSIDWSRGVGLGELFAKLGAGALMGAKAGDSEVQDKMDAFDKAMQTYSMAQANRDDNKARESINIANQNIQALNQYKNDQWQVQAKQIEKDQPQVVDGVLITKTKLPDGTTRETHTPLDPAKQTAALYARANNAIAEANAHREDTWQTYRANRELAGVALPYMMADAMANNNPQGRDSIYAIGLSEAAQAVTETGRWDELYNKYIPNGKAVAQATKDAAMAAAGVAQGTNPTEKQSNLINNYISSQIINDMVNSGHAWALIGGAGKNPKLGAMQMNPDQSVIASVAQQREGDRKVTRTTNAKGQTTVTERGGSSIDPSNLAQYGYTRY